MKTIGATYQKGVRDAESPRRSAGQVAAERRSDGMDAKTAQTKAHEYCLLHYGTSYVGGVPRRLSLPKIDVWIVPVVLTSPGYGAVGDVGVVAVDAHSGQVLGATSRLEVRTLGTRLAQEKRHELDSAFRCARAAGHLRDRLPAHGARPSRKANLRG